MGTQMNKTDKAEFKAPFNSKSKKGAKSGLQITVSDG